MKNYLRLAFILIGLIGLALALGFYFDYRPITQLFPWSLYRLGMVFMTSIFAAIALPVLWIGISGEFGAAKSGLLDFSVMFVGMSIFCFQLYFARPQRLPILYFALATLGLLLLNLVILYFARHQAYQDKRPMPRLVRFSFALFALVLFLTGSALVLQVPNIFPYEISKEVSTIYGWIFLGAMAYFLHGVIEPMWANAKGQLLGFLAYDLVLLIPYGDYLGRVNDSFRLSLILYLAVLVYSALVALYFLFLHPATRFRYLPK